MSKRRETIGKILSWVSIPTLILFVIASAFIVQITLRPYYFWHVSMLGIEQSSGYSFSEIALAFNDVMDFIWFGAPFKTGNMPFSESGKAHFEDCVPLFHLDLYVFLITGAMLLIYLVLVKTKVLPKPRLFGFHPFFFAAIVLLLFLSVILIIGMVDFYTLFELFHKVLFPGKTNWIFDYRTDPVINILPESFFLCCGIFAGIVAGSEIIAMLVSSLLFHTSEKEERKIKLTLGIEKVL
ncbi:MAG: TIGR01906 family membrane protein [Bacilli bacterium]|nr:TIGR01906 family membrane protein [Bacilli bacterium]